MHADRRLFLGGVAAGLTAACLAPRPARSAEKRPVLGLIWPVSTRDVPEEGVAMYGERIEWVSNGLGLDRMTPDGYDAVIGLIPAAAEELARKGAEAIELTGTSLTFYQGEACTRRLRQ